MKFLIPLPRLLLGLIFAVFGLNGFLHFIPIPPPEGTAAQFMGALVVSRYLVAVFALEVIAGGLLLANHRVPLALAILAPIIVNIALYHVLLAPHGRGLAGVTIALWAVLFHHERAAFAGLFSGRPAGTPAP
jgi:putative oxidoreductase